MSSESTIADPIAVNPVIHESWKEVLAPEFEAAYFHSLKQFLVDEKRAGKIIYPPGKLIFNALNSTPFNRVKVVILGQDPYHGPGQAHGLCFSVPDGVPQPPSLKNIFKELHNDIHFTVPSSGNLQKWAEQGVLLLNATLTVQAGMAGSHQGKGWEQFTDDIIRTLSENRSGLVFLLWGRYAQNKEALIDKNKHLILKAAHPSPLSAYNGYFGCKHFSQTNAWLIKTGQQPVNWTL